MSKWSFDTEFSNKTEETVEYHEEVSVVPKKLTKEELRSLDPYDSNTDPRHVRVHNFLNAKIYETQVDRDNETGWLVQRHYAKRQYNNWLRKLRQCSGWREFRRQPLDFPEGKDTNPVITRLNRYYGGPQTVVFKKTVPDVETKTKDNISRGVASYWEWYHSNQTSQSVVAGARIEDEDFVGKMFTQSMGREIAARRSSLGLTQVQLAEAINTDVGTIRDIELGAKVPFNAESTLVKNLSKELGWATIKYRE